MVSISKKNQEFAHILIRTEEEIRQLDVLFRGGELIVRENPKILALYRQIENLMDSYCPRVVSKLGEQRELMDYRMKNVVQTKTVTILSPVKKVLRVLDSAIWEDHDCPRCIKETS